MNSTEARGAQQYLPATVGSIDALRTAAAGCRGCDLYQAAEQTVFGSGPVPARLMLVGEEPGDAEDRAGEPFVGPAGHLLDRALTDVGLERDQAYLTNAVKHFKFTRNANSKRRIHQPPNRGETLACRPWLIAELELVKPAVIVALGATAAKSLMGPSFKVSQQRGTVFPWPDAARDPHDLPNIPGKLLATVHPSAVLRAADRTEAYEAFVTDLAMVAKALAG